MLHDDEANLRACELAYEEFGIPRPPATHADSDRHRHEHQEREHQDEENEGKYIQERLAKAGFVA